MWEQTANTHRRIFLYSQAQKSITRRKKKWLLC